MEENERVEVNSIDTNGLVEVKSYKKANNGLVEKITAGVLAVALLISGYFNYYCVKNHKNHECTCECECECEECKCKEKEVEEKETPAPTKIVPSQVTPEPIATPEPTTIIVIPETIVTPEPTPEPVVTPEPTSAPSPTPVPEDPYDPEVIEDKWETENLSKGETVTFAYYDAAEDKEDNLTKADKAYIQEYMDYYGISYEDARVSYMQFGPLSIPTEVETYDYSSDVEYETRYVFDEDDLASINLFVSELGMTRAEAENYYVNEVAPILGKPIATEIVMLKK